MSADPFPWFRTPDGPRQVSLNKATFLFILAAIAIQSRQMDENKNTFRAFYMFVQDEDHPQFNEAQALTWTFKRPRLRFSQVQHLV